MAIISRLFSFPTQIFGNFFEYFFLSLSFSRCAFCHSDCLFVCFTEHTHTQTHTHTHTHTFFQIHIHFEKDKNIIYCWVNNFFNQNLEIFFFQAHSQYVLSNQQMMQQHSNTMAPSTTSTSLLTQPLMASHQTQGSRAHITLNPYSTQLVENINMMMPDKSSGSSSATNSSSSTTSTTLGRNSHQQSCPMGLNPHLINLTTSLRRGKNPHSNSYQINHCFSLGVI